MDAHSLQVLEYHEVRKLLAGFATSSLSRDLALRMQPSTDPERLRISLGQLEEALSLESDGDPLPTRGLHDILALITRTHEQGRPLEPHELLTVRSTLRVCRHLGAFLRQHAEKAPRLAAIARGMRGHDALLERIEEVVEAPGVVRDEASPRLFDLRTRMRILEDKLRDLMGNLCNDPAFRPHLRERSFSIRNGRFVLAVKLDKKGYVPGILHDKSASGNTAFIEPREVLVHTNQLEDLRLDASREEARVLMLLSREIYAEEKGIGRTQAVAAWLDFCAARARMGVELGWRVVPQRDERRITLREARHPLLEVARRQEEGAGAVVPLNLELGGSFRHLVITGPNTGGKTVILKTVGLLQLMFQSGLPLPVESGSGLPCLETLHADIGDEQSLSQNLSTFSGHIRNIAGILSGTGEKGLVLLDELGAGTDPVEGAALGQALLDEIRAAGGLSLTTTHLGSLKTYAFVHQEVENACVTFDPETFAPTYRLVVGQPGNSNALIIAERYGIAKRVVDQARELVGEEASGTQELIDQLVNSRVAAEESRQLSEDMVAESRTKLEQASQALEEARGEKDRVEREAESEVARILSEFTRAARPHLNALRNVPKSLVEHIEALEELVGQRLQMTPFAARRRAFLRDLRRHDRVFVPRFGQVCRVEKLNRAEERLSVKVGSLSMEIAFDDVSWVTPPDSDEV